jgi:hypothetical protein
VLNGLEWIVLTAAILRVFCRGGSRPLWRPSLLQAIHGPAIAATGFRSSSTAPRIVAAPVTHTARTSLSIAFPSEPFTAVLPVELALERPRGAGLPERRPVDEFVSRAARQFSRART